MYYLPYEGYSYYVDSYNFYHFNVVVPYTSYNYRVEVISPVEPVVSGTTTLPTVTLADVKKWVPSLDGLIDDENSELYPLFLLLRDIGAQIVVYALCGSTNTFKRAVSYYVGHYMELHIKALKDEQNRMTMSAERKNEVESDESKKISMIDGHYGNYKQTLYGQMFWSIYGHLSKFNLGYGVY